MTQESEDAARGRQLEEFRKAKEHLHLLEGEMKEIAMQLAALSDVFKYPHNYSLLIETHSITVGRPERVERPTAVIKDSSLSLESIGRLWNDYKNTVVKKNELSGRLKPYLGE